LNVIILWILWNDGLWLFEVDFQRGIPKIL
jgi:hypothetical protein